MLTQFNSASLNRHIAQTYRLDLFSDGFVEVLAAEQTPESSDWFQGTADAVRQAARHFTGYDADYYLILAGDHLYRMDFCELIESHIEGRADITIAAQPVTRADATQMGIFRFDEHGQIVGFEEKPNDGPARRDRQQHPARLDRRRRNADKPFVASMGIYVFSRDVLLEILEQPGIDFGKEIIPKALATHRVHSYIFRGYWADVGTIEAFYDANIQLTQRGAPFNFFHPRWPIYTHPRFLPATRALRLPRCSPRSSPRAATSISARSATRSSASARTSRRGATIARSVLLGADFYEEETTARSDPARHRPRRRARSRDRRQERAHRRRRAAGQRRRRRARGRRRLLHPQRHHHRAEERRARLRPLGLRRRARPGQRAVDRVNTRLFPLSAPPLVPRIVRASRERTTLNQFTDHFV